MPASAASPDGRASIDQGISPDGYLNPDGTLNLNKDFSGTFDLAGWEVKADSQKGPIFTRGASSPGLTTPVIGNWENLGGGVPMTFSGSVRAMAVLNNGDIVVGGDFTNLGEDTRMDYIARWDGTNWLPLSNSSLNSRVHALAVDGNGNLYVGGDFVNVYNNGTMLSEADYVAKWNGTDWSALSSNGAGNGSLNGGVYALAVDGNGNLYVGGFLTNVNNNGVALGEANYIAKWNGTNWSALGSNGAGGGSLNNPVMALAVDGNGNLHVGGMFTDVNNNGIALGAADYITKWDGTDWSALGSNGAGDGSLNNPVVAVAVAGNGNLYVGGYFTDVNNNGMMLSEADYIAKWNGMDWSPLGSNGAGDGSLNNNVNALAVDGNGNLYVGGMFTNVNNNGTAIGEADYIVKWNGTDWSALGSNGAGGGSLNNGVMALKVAGNGNLYVGGAFTGIYNGANFINSPYFGVWDIFTSSWYSLVDTSLSQQGAANNKILTAVTDGNGNLYVGGAFFNLNGIDAADYVAKWDGTAWSALGINGLGNGSLGGGQVKALAIDGNGNLYAGGVFSNVNNNGTVLGEADYVAKWDGTNWSALGSNGVGNGSLNNPVNALATDQNGNLYVGGWFTNVNNNGTVLSAADYIAKWNGTSWSALGSKGAGEGPLNSLYSTVWALAVDGSGNLYVGGQFDNAGGNGAADNIAKWDGANWLALGNNGVGGGSITENNYGQHIQALALDGNGNLFVGGYFHNVNNKGTVLGAADFVAKWDGTNWSALGSNGAGTGSLISQVYALAVDGNGDLYVGGNFEDVNNNGTVLGVADYVAKWDGTDWSALGNNGAGNGSLNSYVYALGLIGNKLYVGGEFINVNNNGIVLNTADYIAAYGIGDGIYRVAPNGVSTSTCGKTWANACDLQYALTSLATPGDELWVKAGTYKPTTGTDRTKSFILKNGVAIYGGFAGTETLQTQRDPSTNVTVLSGEIGIAGIADNSYHVVVGSGTNNTAILDGFTITAGNADVLYTDNGRGGGMFILSGSPALRNLIFNGNTAQSGGGLFNVSSSPTLTHVIFSNNFAWTGGGMSNYDNSNSILMDVTFIGNSAFPSPPVSGGFGGGMDNFNSNPNLTNVTFNNNMTGGNGGGIINTNSSPILTNVTFSNNSADLYGGGMDNHSSNPTLTNVTFSVNSADLYGGGMYNYQSSPALTNVIIANSATGGDCVNNSSTLNAASANNLIEDAANACGLTNGVNGNIIGVDSKLGPLANNGGFTQTMALLPGSPAINTGNDASCPSTDQRGVTRPQGSQCDIGAYEYQTPSMSVNIGGVQKGNYQIPYLFTQLINYPGFNGGPVQIKNIITAPTSIVTSLRLLYKNVQGKFTYSELMGVPTAQLGTDYWLPYYRNNTVNGVVTDSQVRFTNTSTTETTTVSVYLGSNPTPVYTKVLTPSSSDRINFANMAGGPVHIMGSNSNAKILAGMRVIYGGGMSFDELMAYPTAQLGSEYWFPFYNHNNVNLDSELRIANTSSTTAATVEIYIGGVLKDSTTIPPLSAHLKSFPGFNGGPVRVVSTNGVNLVASLRLLYKNVNLKYTFSELMGVPTAQLSNDYWLPYYKNNPTDTDSQVRFTNTSVTESTTVTIYLGSNPTPIYTKVLTPNSADRINFANTVGGPVHIVGSNPLAKILAGMRVVYGGGMSFDELMAIPTAFLSTEYWFPFYNHNNVNLDTEIRIGVPGTP